MYVSVKRALRGNFNGILSTRTFGVVLKSTVDIMICMSKMYGEIITKYCYSLFTGNV